MSARKPLGIIPRLLLALAVAFAPLAALAQAPAIQAAAVLSKKSTAGLDLNFQTNSAIYRGSNVGRVAAVPGWTFTRATPSVAYAETLAGALIPFAANVPRATDGGFLVEESRTNAVLWDRDLTNAAWTVSNITPAKDQIGADGVANSASSITATAANGTILQVITLASSARFQTARVKRITGSGTIQMTMDAGITWTAITVTSLWTRVSIPTQTLLNPVVGFRIVTSGDAVAVDFVQNENGTFATSDIPTTLAAVTRAADVAIITGLSALAAGPVTLAAKLGLMRDTAGPANENFLSLSDGTLNNRITLFRALNQQVLSARVTVGGSTTVPAVAGVVLPTGSAIAAMRVRAGSATAAAQGVLGTTTAPASIPAFSQLSIGVSESGSGGQMNDYIRRIQILGDVSDGQLVTIPQ